MQLRCHLGQFRCFLRALCELFTFGVQILFNNILQRVRDLLLFFLDVRGVASALVQLLCELFLLPGKLIQLSSQFQLPASLIHVFANVFKFLNGLFQRLFRRCDRCLLLRSIICERYKSRLVFGFGNFMFSDLLNTFDLRLKEALRNLFVRGRQSTQRLLGVLDLILELS